LEKLIFVKMSLRDYTQTRIIPRKGLLPFGPRSSHSSDGTHSIVAGFCQGKTNWQTKQSGDSMVPKR